VAKIALVNAPYFSHVGTLMRLTDVLVRQGHEVVVWAPERCRERVQAWEGTFELHEPDMPHVKGLGFAAELTARTAHRSEALIEQLFRHDVDLLIHDSQAPWAQVAGDYLGVPRLVSHPLFPDVLHYHTPSDAQLQWPTVDPEEATEQFEANWLAIARRWGVRMNTTMASGGNPTITFTTEELLGDFELQPGWHCVGPLMAPIPAATAPGPRPLVYVCFGTSYNGRPALFNTVIAGLADEPVDVLVSMGNGTLSAADLDPLPANVTVRDFVSAREVLARACVHITHGGCNSVHESLLAGVPMVCIPQGWDQFPLSKRIEALGVAAVVGEDPGAVREATRFLLNNAKARAHASELSEHLRHYDGERRVADVIEAVLSEHATLTA